MELLDEMSSKDKRITIRYDGEIERIFDFAVEVFPALAGKGNRAELARTIIEEWCRTRQTRRSKTAVVAFHAWYTNHLQVYIAELVTEFITKGFVSSEWIEKLNKFSEIYTFDMWEKEYLEGKGDYGLQDNQYSKQLEESK